MFAVKGIYKDGKIELVESLPSEIKEAEVYIVIVPKPKKESDEDFFNKAEKSESYYLMKMQQQSGYIQALLNDPDEDVWDDL
jgi:hypothetical protein